MTDKDTTKAEGQSSLYSSICVVGVTAISGYLYWKWREKKLKEQNMEDISTYTVIKTGFKTHVYLQSYSWIRHYLPLLLNNIGILSLLALYQSYRHHLKKRGKKNRRYTYGYREPNFVKIGIISLTQRQFFFTDFLLIASSLNVLFCILMDQMFNSNPFHPLMLYEKYHEYEFIHKYKLSVNQVINNAIYESVGDMYDSHWLLDIIWEYITYDTKKEHMIIDVDFTNPQLKHESFICKKYKSMLSSLFTQYQMDMKYGYKIRKDIIEVQPHFEYFWKVRSFGVDSNVYRKNEFRLKDSQQITQFILWWLVNVGAVYGLNGIFKNIFKNNPTLLWTYYAMILSRESIFYAALIRFTSIKWLLGGIVLSPRLYYYNKSKKYSNDLSKHWTKRLDRLGKDGELVTIKRSSPQTCMIHSEMN